MKAADIARELAAGIDALVTDLLPNGHREGHEWRCGSIAGEPGSSLAVHLKGNKAGVWADFAGGIGGDALDLAAAVLGKPVVEAMDWSRRWLGIDEGEAAAPRRLAPPPKAAEPAADPDRWQRPWQAARPIAGTLAASYLAARGLEFDDQAAQVLRFAVRRARLAPDGGLECRPAMLAALSDARSGEMVGIISTFLAADGCDRLRDRKGRTVTGRARSAVVVLSDFDEPTAGLVLCEGIETGVKIYSSGLRPIWACGGAGTLANFPVLGGIECLTIAADADEPGQKAAEACAARWREAGREVAIVAPPAGDWADPQEAHE